MDPIITGAAVGGMLGLGGGLLGNKASADEARRNRQFQRKMYKHRYQYTVADMRKAGLNPALAYQQGAGSAPSGSMASQDDPIKGGLEGAGRAVATALAVKQQKAQVEQIQAQTDLTRAQAEQLRSESESRTEYWRNRPAGLQSEIEYRQSLMRSNQLAVEFAEKTMGDRVAIAGLNRQEMVEILTQLRQEIELRGLERASLEAQAKFAKTWFGREVAPALGSAQGVLGIFTGLIGPFLRFMEERGRSERDAAKPKNEVESRRTWKGGSTTIRKRY